MPVEVKEFKIKYVHVWTRGCQDQFHVISDGKDNKATIVDVTTGNKFSFPLGFIDDIAEALLAVKQ